MIHPLDVHTKRARLVHDLTPLTRLLLTYLHALLPFLVFLHLFCTYLASAL